MMSILMLSSTNVINFFTENLKILPNGYYFIPETKTAIPPEMAELIQLTEYPSDMVSGKYCYTAEQGIYLNPEWQEPIDITNITDEQNYKAGYDQAVLDLMVE